MGGVIRDPRYWLSLAALIGVIVVSVVRGGGNGASGAAPTPVVPTHAANQQLTGEPALDHALRAALVPDTIEMASLTGYQKVACAAVADAGHPACRAGEHPGTPVEVLLTQGCSRSAWIRPELVPDVYATALNDKQPRLTAVFRPSAGLQYVRLGAEYAAIIATRQAGGVDASVALYIKGGRFVALEDDCGSPQGLLDNARIGAWVVRPGAGTTGPTTTPGKVP